MGEEVINGLDLFSGIGGITLALSEWVKPVAYCEIDPFAQRVLLSRMLEGKLPNAPIWDDIRTLRGEFLPKIDIIYGGFPCQDISVAGNGKGLAGERSGLFFEIVRLAKESEPSFIFLENVPRITSLGLDRVVKELAEIGYNCRWTTLSAAEVGAPHKRERWWFLAYARCQQARAKQDIQYESKEPIRENSSELCKSVSNTEHNGSHERKTIQGIKETIRNNEEGENKTGESQRSNSPRMHAADYGIQSQDTWTIEPDVGRVVNGVLHRVDRIKSLGNAVVPLCAKEAFKELLMGNG